MIFILKSITNPKGIFCTFRKMFFIKLFVSTIIYSFGACVSLMEFCCNTGQIVKITEEIWRIQWFLNRLGSVNNRTSKEGGLSHLKHVGPSTILDKLYTTQRSANVFSQFMSKFVSPMRNQCGDSFSQDWQISVRTLSKNLFVTLGVFWMITKNTFRFYTIVFQ